MSLPGKFPGELRMLRSIIGRNSPKELRMLRSIVGNKNRRTRFLLLAWTLVHFRKEDLLSTSRTLLHQDNKGSPMYLSLPWNAHSPSPIDTRCNVKNGKMHQDYYYTEISHRYSYNEYSWTNYACRPAGSWLDLHRCSLFADQSLSRIQRSNSGVMEVSHTRQLCTHSELGVFLSCFTV